MYKEKIKELWERTTRCSYPRPGKFTAGEYDIHIDAFAKAIIDEAIQVARKADNEDKEYAWFALEKHFGVK